MYSDSFDVRLIAFPRLEHYFGVGLVSMRGADLLRLQAILLMRLASFQDNKPLDLVKLRDYFSNQNEGCSTFKRCFSCLENITVEEVEFILNFIRLKLAPQSDRRKSSRPSSVAA